MTDVDKITLALALFILVAAAFALGVVFRRLTPAERKSLLECPAAIGPIGFVHF